MGKRVLVRVSTLFFALLVLTLSVFETSSVKYAFGAKEPEMTTSPKSVSVTYDLPYPGSVYPGSPLWPVKVLRDKVGLRFSGDQLAQSNYELHLADKRLSAGWAMWEAGDTNEALAIFEKAEGYLAQSFESLSKVDPSVDSRDTIRQITFASLKHREVLEHVLGQCGDEARSMVTKILTTPKDLYFIGSSKMVELGMNPPDNPF